MWMLSIVGMFQSSTQKWSARPCLERPSPSKAVGDALFLELRGECCTGIFDVHGASGSIFYWNDFPAKDSVQIMVGEQFHKLLNHCTALKKKKKLFDSVECGFMWVQLLKKGKLLWIAASALFSRGRTKYTCEVWNSLKYSRALYWWFFLEVRQQWKQMQSFYQGWSSSDV